MRAEFRLNNSPRPSTFKPAWWLPGAHLQTLWPVLQRRFASADQYPALQRERLTLPDGDFLDLDYTSPPSAMPAGTPLILLLHGLEGSSESGYARGLLRVLQQRGWVGIVMHFRGCSGEPNRLRRSYNAGDSGDLAYVIDTLHARWPDSALAAVGYSLGGNVLLKWLAEQGRDCVLQAAAAVSVPFRLADAARRMQQGLSRLYQWHLLRSLRASYRAKFASRDDAPVALDELSQLRDFFQFDDRITAPLHGYDGVEDYYRRASSRQYLHQIETPTLLVHARNDPFMFADTAPTAAELSGNITLELSSDGGHVGFVSGPWPWRPQYWLEQRIPDFLSEYLSRA
ncbi:MAG: hydrolase [Candidatus Competibacteraceae bacterium]|nr:hydrolase [Candidatus Competibacteraceae bacterium]